MIANDRTEKHFLVSQYNDSFGYKSSIFCKNSFGVEEQNIKRFKHLKGMCIWGCDLRERWYFDHQKNRHFCKYLKIALTKWGDETLFYIFSNSDTHENVNSFDLSLPVKFKIVKVASLWFFFCLLNSLIVVALCLLNIW